ncbi:MAG: glycosyltransferase family 4 protein [Pseudomonadota bacterium]
MSKVIVANPGRQHSDQMASGLSEADMLALYVHSAPVRTSLANEVSADVNLELKRYRLAIAASSRLLAGNVRIAVAHRVYARFGEALAGIAYNHIWSAVICTENSALPVFRLARERGAVTILDAASVHHGWQTRLPDPGLARRNAIKDSEIALADHILTCSPMARDSYLEAGVPPNRVHVLSLGVDLDGFSEPRLTERPGPVRFLFIGRGGRAKGTDILAAACARLADAGLDFRLDCLGNLTPDAVEQLRPYATFHGEVAHDQLADHLRAADILVHPSRFDSFGLVVPEALACGTPVIVSDRTGAKYMIRDGETGWTVATEDVDALFSRMAACAAQPDQCRAMRSACRTEALRHDWARYRADAAALVADLIRAGRG